MAKNLFHRKENIILTAIEIIDDLGIQGLSTREIARRQGISEGTLFRHYKSKNEIILAVLDDFSKYDADIIHSVLLKKLKPVEALQFFVDSYSTYYENYPEITAISQMYGVLLYEPDFAIKINEVLLGRKNFIIQFIDEGKKSGDFKSEVDSSALAEILIGSFEFICFSWRLEKYVFSLRERMRTVTNSVLASFKRSDN